MSLQEKNKGLLLAAAGLGGGLAIYGMIQKAKEVRLKGKVVLVTGGTRGFGLELARQFVQEGSHVAICARDEGELLAARLELSAEGKQEVLALRCDVRDAVAVERMVAEATNHFGQIDIVVNNAGMIQVGPVENMTLQDFRDIMDTDFYGMLQTILAVLPQMRNRQDGYLVNITSIAGKMPVPHLLPYSCAKFAATALSEGLHVELAGAGIHVLTVEPGTLRNSSYVHAEFRGQAEKEAAWFAESQMSKLSGVDTVTAARDVIRALKHKEAELVIGGAAAVAAKVHGVMPSWSTAALALMNHFLPGPGQERATGLGLQRSGRSGTLNDLAQEGRATAAQFKQPV